jgi:hypothetical protein
VQAARNGVQTVGAGIYVTASPCFSLLQADRQTPASCASFSVSSIGMSASSPSASSSRWSSRTCAGEPGGELGEREPERSRERRSSRTRGRQGRARTCAGAPSARLRSPSPRSWWRPATRARRVLPGGAAGQAVLSNAEGPTARCGASAAPRPGGDRARESAPARGSWMSSSKQEVLAYGPRRAGSPSGGLQGLPQRVCRAARDPDAAPSHRAFRAGARACLV